ncbi:hypothetical protein [Streptomyces sp. NBC_01353]|uniref:hypothetical protein n=1 Tax=Streptomyces sp. NBC_01353 TaxID=2903835 RepID=UPI002E34BD4D|nr:hypothetical protein [Streptomyces sp. NBC_01353]
MTSAERPSVSPRTERALRDAMERLFTGRPTRTDGKLTKKNLWREAGVSRATMNRATHVLADWDHRIGHSPARLQDRKQADTITALRQHLLKARKTATASRTKSTQQPPSSPPCTPRTPLSVSRSQASRRPSYLSRSDGDPTRRQPHGDAPHVS